jgi:hypothetical protein
VKGEISGCTVDESFSWSYGQGVFKDAKAGVFQVFTSIK